MKPNKNRGTILRAAYGETDELPPKPGVFGLDD
jgi:hypothetical protein